MENESVARHRDRALGGRMEESVGTRPARTSLGVGLGDELYIVREERWWRERKKKGQIRSLKRDDKDKEIIGGKVFET